MGAAKVNSARALRVRQDGCHQPTNTPTQQMNQRELCPERSRADEPVDEILVWQNHESSPPTWGLLERSVGSGTIGRPQSLWHPHRKPLLQSRVAGRAGARVRLELASGNRNGSGACPCSSGLRSRRPRARASRGSNRGRPKRPCELPRWSSAGKAGDGKFGTR